ncbi:MAG TPA: thioredoxin domain-containing protein, partial [Gemmatimonadales bacterium]|nr:thioredoxin domain-containing protein [Gemmatimonadales bacterium]
MAGTPAGLKQFYFALAAVALVGAGALAWVLARPATVSIPANVTVQTADTAGFSGYVLGDAGAPLELTEYADYQCPFCQTFATLQMPTIRQRLIQTGRIRWRFR